MNSSSGSPVVTVSDLRVRFRGSEHDAVAGVSFELRRGEVLALVGESGSGKTVTARALLGLLPSTAAISGSVTVGDDAIQLVGADDTTWATVRGSRIAMVFQEPQSALNPVRTIGWQLDQVLRTHGLRSSVARRERALSLLELVGIPDPTTRLSHHAHEFSGGQKQRIVLALALAAEPDVLIADEPTTALDVTVQQEILDLLKDLRHSLGMAVLLITHNMGVVADLADRVHVLHRAVTVESGGVEALFARPERPYTRALLAAVPRLPVGERSEQSDTAEVAETPDRSESVVSVEGITLGHPGRLGRRPVPVLHDLDLRVGRGEVLGVVGESGSGKTTVLHALTGALQPTRGTVSVLGQDLGRLRGAELRALRSRIGVVPRIRRARSTRCSPSPMPSPSRCSCTDGDARAVRWRPGSTSCSRPSRSTRRCGDAVRTNCRVANANASHWPARWR